MADAKISALTALVVPTLDDILAIVDDPAGTPVTKKITLANLVPGGINGLLYKVLTANATAQSVATVQPWFPSAGAVTVAASTTYFFDGLLLLTNGATTHTTGLSFTGTATLTSIDYHAEVHSAAANAIATTISQIQVSVATNTVINGTSTAVNATIRVKGVVRVNAGGTFIPNFTWSANPTSTNEVKRNTYFRLWPIGTDTVVSQGTWA